MVAAADKVFEGHVKMKLSEGGTEHTIDYYVKGDRMRVEMQDPRLQGGTMIMNMEERQMTVLMPEQRMYMTMPIPDGVGPAAEADEKMPEETGETRTILGHTARQYMLEEEDRQFEIWATDELGAFAGLHLPDQGQPGATSQRKHALTEQDFFPLLIIERQNGRETTRVEMVEINEEELSASLFEPPAGFRGMSMPTQGLR